MDDFILFPCGCDEPGVGCCSYSVSTDDGNLSDHGGLGFESSYGPGMSLALSPSLLTTSPTSAPNRSNHLTTADLSITDPFKALPVGIDQPSYLDTQPSTTGVTLQSVSTSKQSRRRYSPKTWTAIQPLVGRLYLNQGRPLHETMRILEEEHCFKASYVFNNAHFPSPEKEARLTSIFKGETIQNQIQGMGFCQKQET